MMPAGPFAFLRSLRSPASVSLIATGGPAWGAEAEAGRNLGRCEADSDTDPIPETSILPAMLGVPPIPPASTEEETE